MSESLDNFINMIKDDKKRAMALFFSESFKDEYLGEDSEYKKVYHQLLLGRNREQILEEFLITIDAKEPVRLFVTDKEYKIKKKDFDEPLVISIKKEGCGAVEGRICIDGDFLELDKETFDQNDFEDGRMDLHVYMHRIPEDGAKEDIKIITVSQAFTMEVCYVEEENEEIIQGKKKDEEVLDCYIEFCTGQIPLEEFIEREHRILERMPWGWRKVFYRLFSVHLRILDNDLTIQEDDFTLPEEGISEELRSYGSYLKALYTKRPEDIKKAVDKTTEIYKESGKKAFLLWILIYIDESLAYDQKKQLNEMKDIYQRGFSQKILMFEACSIWNEVPELLHKLSSFELDALEFGVQKNLLSENLVQRICFLSSKEKVFSEETLLLLMHIYEVMPVGRVLQGICVLLIQGNCMDRDCHPYYQKAVMEEIQVIGLQEAFLRTIPEGEYKVLPEETLVYFTYSNSLSRREQSRLYANVIKNRRRYGSLFENYQELIRGFIAEELQQGQMNQYLLVLYQFYFEEILENEEMLQNLGNVIFYREFLCENEFLKKMVIFQKQKDEPETKFLNGDPLYVEIFDHEPLIVFFDQEENRYIGSANWHLKRVWGENQVQEYLSRAGQKNEHYLSYQSMEYYEKDTLCKEDFPTVLSVLECSWMNTEYIQHIFEKVLKYYWKSGQEEKLKEYLAFVDWKSLSTEGRIHMIEYFIAGGFYDEALKGIQQYGYQFLDIGLLNAICLYALTTLSTRRSEILVGMCSRVFEQGAGNSEIIGYLQKYFTGSKKQMLQLWKAGSEIKMYYKEFVEQTLQICISDGIDESVFPVFLEYIRKADKKQGLVDAVLVEYVDLVSRNQIKLPEEFYELIGKKIDEGKIDQMYQGLYLNYYREKELGAYQQIRIQKIRDIELKSGNIMPVLFEYDHVISLPKYLYSETFIEYYTEEGQQIMFHYSSTRGKKWQELTMKELMPGYYVSSAVIFADEIMDYFITVPGEEKRRRKDIFFIDHINKSKGSRFYELNEMLKEQQRESIQTSMEQYLLKQSMIEFIKPMIEDELCR